MRDSSLEETVVELARSGTSPKDIMQTLKKSHPKASKKQVILAAFTVMIDMAERDSETSLALQNFAISAGKPVSGD